jgi:hypothetical protein
MFLVKQLRRGQSSDPKNRNLNDLEKRLIYNPGSNSLSKENSAGGTTNTAQAATGISDMIYKYGISFQVRGIGYRIEYKKETREIELYIGYSNIIKKKVPLNLEIEVISGNEILIKPKYNVVKTNNQFYIESATFNDITQFTNQLKLIKPAYKDTYKNQGCESIIIRS